MLSKAASPGIELAAIKFGETNFWGNNILIDLICLSNTIHTPFDAANLLFSSLRRLISFFNLLFSSSNILFLLTMGLGQRIEQHESQ